MSELRLVKTTKVIDLIEYKRTRKLRKIKKIIDTLHSPELKYPFYTFVSLSFLITVGSILFFFLYTSKF